MTRGELRQFAYAFAQVDDGSVTTAMMDLFLGQACVAFARDVGGLHTDLTLHGASDDGRAYALPAATNRIVAAYYVDARQRPLAEGDTTNGFGLDVLRDPDFGGVGGTPAYYAVEQATPPRLWLDAPIPGGRRVDLVVSQNAVSFGPDETDEPVLSGAYHEALAYYAASYAARMQRDEAVVERRQRDYRDLVARYAQERATKEPAGMALSVPGGYGVGGGYELGRVVLVAGGGGRMPSNGVTPADIYQALKQILHFTGNLHVEEDDQARTITFDVIVGHGTDLLPQDRAVLDKAVQVDGIALDGRQVSLASTSGTIYHLTLPGLTVRDGGTLLGGGDLNTVAELNFEGHGVTARQVGSTVTLTFAGAGLDQEQIDARVEALAPAARLVPEGVSDDAGKLLTKTADGQAWEPLAVTPAKLDAGTDTKKVAFRTAIGAGGVATPGTGIRLGAPDDAGRYAIGLANPEAAAGGDLSNEHRYTQPLADARSEPRFLLVERGQPVYVRMSYNAGDVPPNYSGTFDLPDGKEGGIEYVRVVEAGQADRGLFEITVNPGDVSDTLANLFHGTITHMLIRIGSSEASAETAPVLRIAVERDRVITNGLAFKSASRLTAQQEGLLASANVVVLRVNFVIGSFPWRSAPAYSLSETALTAAFGRVPELAGCAAKDGRTVAVIDIDTRDVRVFVNGDPDTDQYPTLTRGVVEAEIGANYAGGLTWKGDHLYLINGSTGKVGAFINGAAVPSMGFQATGGSEALATDGTDFYIWGTAYGVQKWGADGNRDLSFTALSRAVIDAAASKSKDAGGMYYRDGYLYLADRDYQQGKPQIFPFSLAGVYDSSKAPPQGLLRVNSSMRGLSEADGVLYVAYLRSVDAIAVVADRLGFSEDYEQVVMTQQGARNFVRERHVGSINTGGNVLSWQDKAADGTTTPRQWTPPQPDLGFNEAEGSADVDFRMVVREKVAGTPTGTAVVFAQVPGTPGLYRSNAPLPGITSLEFDTRAGSPSENRYVIRLPQTSGDGLPIAIWVNGNQSDDLQVAPVQEPGVSVIWTTAQVGAQRVSDSNLTNSIDIQYGDGGWINGVNATERVRTYDRDLARKAMQGIPDWTHFPGSPITGERGNLLAAQTIGAVTYEPGDYTWDGAKWTFTTLVVPERLRYAAGTVVAAGKVPVIADTEKWTLDDPATSWAQEGNTDTIPASRQAIRMTQAQYDAAAAAGTIDADTYYDVIG